MKQKVFTNNNDVSNDTNNISSDNINIKTLNQKENTNKQLSVMVIIATMEPATESHSSRAYTQL